MDKRVVVYCTGGVRCEKFSGWMVHELFFMVTDPLWQFTEVTNVWTNGSTEVTKVILIVVTCIEDNSVLI